LGNAITRRKFARRRFVQDQAEISIECIRGCLHVRAAEVDLVQLVAGRVGQRDEMPIGFARNHQAAGANLIYMNGIDWRAQAIRGPPPAASTSCAQ